MSVQPRQRLTYADYASLPDDGIRRQLIDGELIVTPAPKTRHQVLVIRLAAALHDHVTEHGGGTVLVAPYDVVLTPYDVVQPDVVFIGDDRSSFVTEANLQGPPTLAVEVVSDPRLDRVRKRDLYATARIPCYWAIDPDADRIEVFRLEGDGYGKPVIVESGNTLVLHELPGLAIDVASLFRR